MACQWLLVGCGVSVAQTMPMSQPVSGSADRAVTLDSAKHLFTADEAVVAAPIVSDGRIIVEDPLEGGGVRLE